MSSTERQRSLEELIDRDEPGIALIRDWREDAERQQELPAGDNKNSPSPLPR